MMDCDYFQIDLHEPFPIIENISEHKIAEGFLIIGYEKGVITTLNKNEKIAFDHLIKFKSPSAAILNLHKEQSAHNVCSTMEILLDKIVNSGFSKAHEGVFINQTVSPKKYLRVHITNKCQLTCSHCYANSSPNSCDQNELDTKQWKEIIKSASDTGCESILFTGGEALVRRDCVDLIKFSKSLNLQVRLFSNGILINKYLEIISTNCENVQISIDGIDEQSNSLIRGKNTFSTAIKAVHSLIKNKVNTTICMTITDSTWQKINNGFEEFIKLFPDNEYLKFKVCFLNNYGRADTLKKVIPTKEMDNFFDKYRNILDETDNIISCKTRSCGYCEQIVISPTGEIYPCHYLEESLGLFKEKSIHDWHRILEENYKNNTVDKVKICNECDLKYFCGGTCRFMNKKHKNSKYISFCTIEQRKLKYEQLYNTFSKNN